MILVDTSVIVDFLRTGDSNLAAQFQSLPGAVCGPIRSEVLHGARSSADRTRLLTILDAFVQIPLSEKLWDDIGDLLARLRINGVKVPFNDAAIACVAVSAGLKLWTRDNQFDQIQRIETSLRLFQESA